MHLELADCLLCPADHDPTYCVVASQEMVGRRVVRGTVGCPVCKSEYPVIDGAVIFGDDPLLVAGSRSDDLTVEDVPRASAIQALLSLTESAGYVVLVGSAARLAQPLADLIERQHFVGVNPPPEVCASDVLSVIRAPTGIPLRPAVARGVVLGREYTYEPWLAEAARVLMTGSRLVVQREGVAVPGFSPLAVGEGLWVGAKSD